MTAYRGYDAHRPGSAARQHRHPPSKVPPEHAVLRLQQQAGNRAVAKLLAGGERMPAVQRNHHTAEARLDNRLGAIMKLSRFRKGSRGYSLWGVYRNFHLIAGWFPWFGTGAGLPALIDRRQDWLSQLVSADKEERLRDSLEWADDEADAFDSSLDPATQRGGRLLSARSRGKLFNFWQSAGRWIPDFLKSNPPGES